MILNKALTLILTGTAFTIYSASALSMKSPLGDCNVIEFAELSSLDKKTLVDEYCLNKTKGDLAGQFAAIDIYENIKKYNSGVSQNCKLQQERILRVLGKKKIDKPSCE